MSCNILNFFFILLGGWVGILYRNYLQRNFERHPSIFKPTFRDVDFDVLYPKLQKKPKVSSPTKF